MGVIRSQQFGAEIVRDEQKPHRVYDAIGEKARAWTLKPGLPCDDTTGTPTQFVVTVTGSSTLAAGTADGYPLIFTTGGTDYNGVNAQLRGETAVLDSDHVVFLRAKVKGSEASTSDLLFGLCELKTDLLATGSAHGVTGSAVEGAFFHKVSGAAAINFKVYKDGVQVSSVAVGTLGTTDIDLAMVWNGSQFLIYVDDVEVARVAGGGIDGVLTPSFNFRTGAAAAITLQAAELSYVSIEAA